MLTVISAVYLLALVVLVVEMATAPVGYQDHDGFHCGDEPAADFDPYQAELLNEEAAPLHETTASEPKPSAYFA